MTPTLDAALLYSSRAGYINDKMSQEERRERERVFLGGQMDMQESKKDRQIGIKYPILYYLRLQRD